MKYDWLSFFSFDEDDNDTALEAEIDNEDQNDKISNVLKNINKLDKNATPSTKEKEGGAVPDTDEPTKDDEDDDEDSSSEVEDVTEETDDAMKDLSPGDNDSDDSSGDDSDNLDSTDDMGSEQEADPSEARNKKKIHRNTIEFYKLVNNNIQTLSTHDPSNLNKDIASYYTIQDTLQQIKEQLYIMASETIKSDTYVESLRKYVSIMKIYDIILISLNNYFEKEEVLKKNKKQNKITKKNSGNRTL